MVTPRRQCVALASSRVTGTVRCAVMARSRELLCSSHRTQLRKGREVLHWASRLPIEIQVSRPQLSTGGSGPKPPPLTRPSGAELGPGLVCEFAVPIQIRSGNVLLRMAREVRAEVVRSERRAVVFAALGCGATTELRIAGSVAFGGGRLEVVMTRVFVPPARVLDDDNLTLGLKAVRDEIAALIGIDDGRGDLVRYRVAQEPGQRAGVIITVREVG